MSILSAKYFHDEDAAYEKLESIVWPEGPVCPHCGACDRISRITGKSARKGLRFCGHCRKQFTVKVGTVLESSRVPIYKWLQAMYLIVSSKKGISAHQLHRTLEVTYKTAWFMMHRIREAMRPEYLEAFGGEGKTVEVDETFIGTEKEKAKNARGYSHKYKILTLVERDGRARSMVVDDLKADTIVPILQEQIDNQTRIMTDEARQYTRLDRHFAEHHFVSHSKGEYGRGEVYTNTIEGFFSIFKRGMKGVYQHCAKQHLPRYIAEFDFRYNERETTDSERTDTLISGIVGKRLMYRDSPAALASA